MIRGIAFDFDGTLVDSNDIKRQTFYKVTKSHDPAGSTVTRILNQFPHIDRYGIFQAIVRELIANEPAVDPKDLNTLATQWAEAYTVECEKAIEQCGEVPGASETLRWISEQPIPIFINSRTPTATLKRLVTLRSLDSYVSQVFGASASKSENLEHIQNQTQAKPKELLFVGDSDDDREAALEVGWHFVGVVLGVKSRFSSPPPEYCITNLLHLQPIVTALHRNNSQSHNTH